MRKVLGKFIGREAVSVLQPGLWLHSQVTWLACAAGLPLRLPAHFHSSAGNNAAAAAALPMWLSVGRKGMQSVEKPPTACDQYRSCSTNVSRYAEQSGGCARPRHGSPTPAMPWVHQDRSNNTCWSLGGVPCTIAASFCCNQIISWLLNTHVLLINISHIYIYG